MRVRWDYCQGRLQATPIIEYPPNGGIRPPTELCVSKNCLTSAASYSAANAIAQHGKPFQEGEFLKEAWLACAPSLFDDFDNKDKIIQRNKDVPLSRNTMKDRILKLAENVTDQQKK
ncbi:general transcription factor II-I repeat domain-containing protein 2A [Trichonephila clavipes]|nr:general transcription factor II-I repeat domain-containing protein 2A [Trichonephila clavipes]